MSTPKPESDNRQICLKLVFPDRESVELTCDSVKFSVRDNEKGTGGGLYGIRPGHAKAVFVLEKGTVTAMLDGKTVLKQDLGEGFAKVGKDCVTLITSSVENI